MNPYWLGVLTPFVVAIAAVGTWILMRSLLWVGGRISVTLVKTRRDMSSDQRALFAATAYASERGWFLALGDFGVAVFAGQDTEARSAAYDRVRERVTLRRFEAASTAHLASDADKIGGVEG